MFRYFLLFTLYLFSTVAFGEQKRLAVLEFRGVGVNDGLLRVLSDKVREGVLDVSKGITIDGESLIIMTRENMERILKDQGKTAEDCIGDCVVDLAKNMGADYVISGELVMIDDLFVFTIKLHETQNSNLLAAKSLETEEKRSLLSNAQKLGTVVFQQGLNIDIEY